jgi:hypothetical protein
MSTSGRRKCCHCGGWFKPDPRNRQRQKFCRASECRLASKRKSQLKWTSKNKDYFRGEEAVKRVQAWRQMHPGYWRGTTARGAGDDSELLQDPLILQSAEAETVNSLRKRLEADISRPLQDLLIAQQHALVGLTVMMVGDALQDDIVAILGACYERGRRYDGVVPWSAKQETSNERTRTDHAAVAATHSDTVQLGRSSTGP